MKSDAGFSESIDRELLKEAKIDTVDDFQKHDCLVFDEVPRLFIGLGMSAICC